MKKPNRDRTLRGYMRRLTRYRMTDDFFKKKYKMDFDLFEKKMSFRESSIPLKSNQIHRNGNSQLME